MTGFETFLSAIARLSPAERETVLGDQCLIYPPDEHLGYESTLRDVVAFGAMGVESALFYAAQHGDEKLVAYLCPRTRPGAR